MLRWLVAGELLGILLYSYSVSAAQTPHYLHPHRAIYRVDLAHADYGTGLASARGAMIVEWKEDCRDWSLEQGLRVVFLRREGDEVATEIRYAGRESKNGQEYRFKFLNVRDGSVLELRRGHATKADDRIGSAILFDPVRTEFVLPAETIFPVDHFRRLIAAAKNGAAETRTTVFDGTSGDGLFDSHAMIRRPAAVEAILTWRLDAAFFPLSGASDLPVYEVSYDLDSHGVVHGATLDYGTFSLRAALERVEWLALPKCG